MPEIGHIFSKGGGELTEFGNDYICVKNSQINVDVDGANGQHGKPPAYAPSGYGGQAPLDSMGDAGTGQGDWWALVMDGDGNPIVQGNSDPCPGAYVSETSLYMLKSDGSQFDRIDPMRYVDAATVPFLVICPQLKNGVAPIVLGCRAVLTNTEKNIKIEAVVADGGNSDEMGEISLAAAQQLQINANAKAVIDEGHMLTMEIYPGTAAVVDGVTYPLQSS
ncbi:MAG: hypothetical protein ACI8UO_005739 [Verrucomicrobiales bacterium]|jgi:hypothetical protein